MILTPILLIIIVVALVGLVGALAYQWGFNNGIREGYENRVP